MEGFGPAEGTAWSAAEEKAPLIAGVWRGRWLGFVDVERVNGEIIDLRRLEQNGTFGK